MHLFFSKNIRPGYFAFDPEESKHISRVLRLGQGDRILLTDGRGNLCKAEITTADQRKCAVLIGEPEVTMPSAYHLHIAVAPTKNLSRLEWFVEKAIETGIGEITPLQCDHSERVKLKSDRLEKVAISALKQSRQTRLAKINPLEPFNKFISRPLSGSKFIAYVDDKNDLPLLSKSYNEGENATILIGPEGDFSRSEITAAVNAGFVPISLGENRLRTETAALVACFTINLINQQKASK
jgi:16S rRNA (uracil1498-N3)-methyltransferase